MKIEINGSSVFAVLVSIINIISFVVPNNNFSTAVRVFILITVFLLIAMFVLGHHAYRIQKENKRLKEIEVNRDELIKLEDKHCKSINSYRKIIKKLITDRDNTILLLETLTINNNREEKTNNLLKILNNRKKEIDRYIEEKLNEYGI